MDGTKGATSSRKLDKEEPSMKRFPVLITAGLLLFGTSVPALAGSQGATDWEKAGEAAQKAGNAFESAGKASWSTMKYGAEWVGDAMGVTNQKEQTKLEESKRAQHWMPGTITSLDKQNGLMTFRSEGETLKLSFPPDSLAGLHDGQKLKVELAYSDLTQGSGEPAGENRAHEAAGSKAETGPKVVKNWVIGDVTDVNHETGIVDLKSGKADLTVHFPPKTIESVKAGDHIAVKLAFAHPAASA